MDDCVDTDLQELHDALDQFEASVEMPFVPGEMERWIAAVEAAWNGLLPVLTWLIGVRHPEQYAEIRQEDQELIHRIERMRQEDAAIDSVATELGQQVQHMKTAISNVEPDEAQLKQSLESFVDDSIRLVIRIRKQQRAVRTWLLEAFTRDRGTVD